MIRRNAPAVQAGQVEGVIEHAGVHLGRHACGRREQFPVMGEFTGLARAQAQRRQCGRGPATGQADQRLQQPGPDRREFGQHQGTQVDRGRLRREGLGLRRGDEDKHRGTVL